MGISFPNSGSLSIMGSDNNLQLISGRKNIGFMMDSKFFPYLNAFENIDYFRDLKGIVDREETNRVLKLVDLYGVKKAYKNFSMGMKQRLSLANALIGNPDIVILDEPVNGLDPQGIVDFRKMIQRMNKDSGITFLISSHILNELALLSTRFGIIHNGTLIEEITQEELYLKSQGGILVNTSNQEMTAVLLEQDLNVTDYKVINNHEIIIYSKDVIPSLIAKTIVNAGLDLNRLSVVEATLEDHFLALTGGES